MDSNSMNLRITPYIPEEIHVIDEKGQEFPIRRIEPAHKFRAEVKVLNFASVLEKKKKGTPKQGQRAESELSSDDEGGPLSRKGKEENKEEEEDAEREKKAPEEHPMATAGRFVQEGVNELNLLVNLLEISKSGQFVKLQHLTAAQTGSWERNGQKLINLRKSQLRECSKTLFAGAKKLREIIGRQRQLHNNLLSLRSRWRVIAPSHVGKIPAPLRVGVPLAIDCSYDHRGDIAEEGQAKGWGQHLVYLRPSSTGGILLRPMLREFYTLQMEVTNIENGQSAVGVLDSDSGNIFGNLAPASGDEAEQTLQEQHEQLQNVRRSLFSLALFEQLRMEALELGKNGWIPSMENSKRLKTEGNSAPSTEEKGAQATCPGRAAPVAVIYILNHKVCLRLTNALQFTFQLLQGDAAMDALQQEKKGISQSSPALKQLCRLGLLHAQLLMHVLNEQKNREAETEKDKKTPKPVVKKEKQQEQKALILPQVLSVLRHKSFKSEAVGVLAKVAAKWRQQGIKVQLNWINTELQFSSSLFHLKMGPKLSVNGIINEDSVDFQGVYGLFNFLSSREIKLQGIWELQQFLEAEACRQIIFLASHAAKKLAPKGALYVEIHLFKLTLETRTNAQNEEADEKDQVEFSIHPATGPSCVIQGTQALANLSSYGIAYEEEPLDTNKGKVLLSDLEAQNTVDAFRLVVSALVGKTLVF